jgi:hypothetical protein
VRRTLTKAIILTSILLFIFSVSTAFADGPSINLPTDPVKAKYDYVWSSTSNSYWLITLSEVPDGYDVINGPYDGWCVDEGNTISNHQTLYVTLYSSYDTRALAADPDWPYVNYILNHPQGDAVDMQNAIWYFINQGGDLTDPDAQAMVDDAVANGGSFVPQQGQILAVVVDPELGNKQLTFIEWTVPINGVIPEYPIGPILGSVSFVVALGLFKCRHALPTVFRFKRD